MLNKIYICTLLLLLTVSTFAQKNVVQSEKDFYALKTVAIPDNVKL